MHLFLIICKFYYIAISNFKYSLETNNMWRIILYLNLMYSKKSLNYWLQIFSEDDFTKYDYGEEENLKRYGSIKPPSIDISAIRDVPIAIFWGIHDKVHPVAASRRIKDELHQSVLKYYNENDYGHMSYIVGKDASYNNLLNSSIKYIN